MKLGKFTLVLVLEITPHKYLKTVTIIKKKKKIVHIISLKALLFIQPPSAYPETWQQVCQDSGWTDQRG